MERVSWVPAARDASWSERLCEQHPVCAVVLALLPLVPLLCRWYQHRLPTQAANSCTAWTRKGQILSNSPTILWRCEEALKEVCLKSSSRDRTNLKCKFQKKTPNKPKPTPKSMYISSVMAAVQKRQFALRMSVSAFFVCLVYLSFELLCTPGHSRMPILDTQITKYH